MWYTFMRTKIDICIFVNQYVCKWLTMLFIKWTTLHILWSHFTYGTPLFDPHAVSCVPQYLTHAFSNLKNSRIWQSMNKKEKERARKRFWLSFRQKAIYQYSLGEEYCEKPSTFCFFFRKMLLVTGCANNLCSLYVSCRNEDDFYYTV